MRIVHVLPGLTKGGAERVAVDLANDAAASGHEVAILVGFEADPALLADRLRPDIEVRLIAPAGAGAASRYAGGLRWVRQHWDWLGSRDVIHCHLTFGAAIGSAVRLLRRIRRASRPAVVETCHGVGMPVPRARRKLAALFAADRDAVAMMAEDAYWNGFRERRPRLLSRTILNGVSAPRAVDAAERLAYRRAVGIPEGAGPLVGTIGALRPERRSEDFIPAFEEIARRLGPGPHFFIGGDGPARGRLEQAVAASGIAGRIHLGGLVRDPAPALAQLDLYLTLNVASTTGIAALEAAMAGVPVLALQLVEGYRASDQDWIWSTPDPVALGVRAAELLADRDALRSLAAAQRAHAFAHHAVPAMGAAYEDLYEAALQRAARR